MSFSLENISKKMTDELDQAVIQKTATGFLMDNAMREKFVGTKTVMVPNVYLPGLADYSRDTGFVTGAVSVSAYPLTLQMDRGRSFQLDREDNDESGIADLAGQVLGEFVRTQVVPEIDAYTISKIANEAYRAGQTLGGNPETEAVDMVRKGIAKVQDKVGYDEELVAFVNHTMWTALQNSDSFTNVLLQSDFKRGELNTQVTSYNGVPIIPVSSSRMYTEIEIRDGVSENNTVGGFGITPDSYHVGLLIMPRRAASIIKKTEQVRCFTPEQNQNADAWKLDYRLYYDVVLRESMLGSIYGYFYM